MEGDFLQDNVSIPPFPWDKICITNSKTAIKHRIVVSMFKFVVSFEDSYQFLHCDFLQENVF